jgi:hypothetical protein
MLPRDFLNYCQTLAPADWQKMVTSKWTVKDVVAHLLGWEREDPEIIQQAWATKTPPWFESTNERDDAFNQRAIDEFHDVPPDQLLAELARWQDKVEQTIQAIGEDELKKYPKIFRWLFEGPNGSRGNKHYQHHYGQIVKAVAST